jgi:hypothetical protein
MKTALECRVEAVNLANSYANEFYPKLVEVFTPFVGQKIYTQNEYPIKKIQHLVDNLSLPKTPKIYIYDRTTTYSLSYVVKVCIVNNGIAHYHESYFYIGEIQNGVLTKICEKEEFKTDYNAKDVEQARLEYQEAKRLASEAESKLFPFGEYDR